MTQRTAGILLLLIACLNPTASTAATLDHVDNEMCDLTLTGSITPGDADLLEPHSYEYFPVTLCLDSEGGNYSEGLKLFDVIWAGNINTLILPGDRCLSACALAFMGGSNVQGTDSTRQIERVIFPGAMLGFHGPFLNLPSGRSQPTELVELAFRDAIQSARSLFELNQIKERGGLAISDFLYGTILNTPQDELFLVETIGDLVVSDVWPAGLAPLYPFLPDTAALKSAAGHEIFKNICINLYVARPPEGSYFALSDSTAEHYVRTLNPFGGESAGSHGELVANVYDDAELTVDVYSAADGSVFARVAPLFSGSKYGAVECTVRIAPRELFEAPIEFERMSPTGFHTEDDRLVGALRYVGWDELEGPWIESERDLSLRGFDDLDVVPFWYVYPFSTPLQGVPVNAEVISMAERSAVGGE